MDQILQRFNDPAEFKKAYYLLKDVRWDLFREYNKDDVIEIFYEITKNKIRKNGMVNLAEYFDKVLKEHEDIGHVFDQLSDEKVPMAGKDELTRNPEKDDLDQNLEKDTLAEFIDVLHEHRFHLNPAETFKHHYLVLDSDLRDLSNESANITSFRWNYAATFNTTVGFCNSVEPITNIIGMRLYQPRVPYVAAMDTDAKRVSVLFDEFSAQAFIAENGRRFHYLLRPIYRASQTSIELSTEDYNDGIFNFRTPISSFDRLTVSFGDPLNVITFTKPFDRFILAIEFVCINV